MRAASRLTGLVAVWADCSFGTERSYCRVCMRFVLTPSFRLLLFPHRTTLSLTHIRDGGTLSGCWNGPDSIAGPALMTDADGATTEASEGWSAAGGFAGAIVERHVHQLAGNLSQQPSVQLPGLEVATGCTLAYSTGVPTDAVSLSRHVLLLWLLLPPPLFMS